MTKKQTYAGNSEYSSQERVDATKAAKIFDSFTDSDRQRYQVIRTKLELEYAKAYGGKLPDICVVRLLTRSVLDAQIYSAIVSGKDSYLPQSQEEWSTHVTQTVEADLFSNAAIVAADHTWKGEVRERALASLSGAEKLAKDRAGILDEFLDGKVREAESARAGL